MMKVILKGDERTVKAIIRENRVRVSRGRVSFSPADSKPAQEESFETDTKEAGVTDVKKPNEVSDTKGKKSSKK